MKALVYHGPGQKSWESVDDPKPVEPTDIVVRIDTTTICGTDLHILKGDVVGGSGAGKRDEVVVVVGAGRGGLPAIQPAGLAGAASVIAVPLADSRLEHARRFGADYVLNGSAGDLEERIAALTTAGQGA